MVLTVTSSERGVTSHKMATAAAHDGGGGQDGGQLRFGCTAKELKELMETRGVDAVNQLKHKYGTVDELCRRLVVSSNEGKHNTAACIFPLVVAANHPSLQ